MEPKVAALLALFALLPKCGPGQGGGDEHPVVVPPGGTAALTIERDVDLDGFAADRYRWIDADGEERTAALVRNDQADPTGNKGGYLREATYVEDGETRTCSGATAVHPGWGYTSNHFGANGMQATLSHRHTGTFRRVLAGRHHAIHEYTWDLPIDGHTVPTTIRWLFATGRDHPLWSVTFDASGAAPGAITADTRAPYGDLQFDDGAGADVDGLSWGDAYVFRTLGSGPVTQQTGWRYDEPNTVPFVRMWSNAVDAEMGAVQTQRQAHRPAGGFWLYPSWGTQAPAGPMPEDWNWTYQLNQYELSATTKSKRLAWGSNYGAIGAEAYPAYGDDRMLSGWPYQSYSVFMVLGAHQDGAVPGTVVDVDNLHELSASCTTGAVATSGPGGIARTDDVAYDVPGYDPVTATIALQADGGRASCSFTLPSGGVSAPIVRVRGAATSTTITVDGAPAVADRDVYVTADPDGDALWITLPGVRAGTTTIDVAP